MFINLLVFPKLGFWTGLGGDIDFGNMANSKSVFTNDGSGAINLPGGLLTLFDLEVSAVFTSDSYPIVVDPNNNEIEFGLYSYLPVGSNYNYHVMYRSYFLSETAGPVETITLSSFTSTLLNGDVNTYLALFTFSTLQSTSTLYSLEKSGYASETTVNGFSTNIWVDVEAYPTITTDGPSSDLLTQATTIDGIDASVFITVTPYSTTTQYGPASSTYYTETTIDDVPTHVWVVVEVSSTTSSTTSSSTSSTTSFSTSSSTSLSTSSSTSSASTSTSSLIVPSNSSATSTSASVES